MSEPWRDFTGTFYRPERVSELPAAYLKGPDALPTIGVPHWCAGKERFESAVLAQRITDRKRELNRQVYWCRCCGSFHIGSAYKEANTASKAIRAELVRG